MGPEAGCVPGSSACPLPVHRCSYDGAMAREPRWERPVFESWVDRQIREATERGEFDVVAKVDKSVMAGVTVCSMGYWRKNSLSLSTPASLNPTVFADLGNAPTFSDTLVEVALVEGVVA